MTKTHTPNTIKVIIIVALILPVIYLIFSFSNSSLFKPELPIELSLRNSLLSSSLVLKLQNNSSETLTISATFENVSLNKKKSADIKVAAEKKKEYGFLQGWGFQTGDEIHLTHPDYASLNYIIPNRI